MSKKMNVKMVRFHDAVQAGGTVLSSLSTERHAANLGAEPIEILSFGIHFVFNGVRIAVPFTNTPYIEFFSEEPSKGKSA
jgi:hypothetical protein